VIAFERVGFHYPVDGTGSAPPAPVLAGLDLRIERGDFLGIIGPNGAGKSTAVRLLLGVLSPTAGRVLLDGREPHRIPARELARMLAAVTQEEPVDFPFTAEEVVLMGRIAHLGPLGFERAADLEAAARAMASTGVAALGARPFHALSGGERKRVLLARALAQGAPLLVLDEPAAALDIHHQIAIFDLLAERNRGGDTVVVVVHDLNLAAAYCKRLLLLPEGGAPPLVGPVEEVLTYRRVREAFGVEVYVGVNELTGDRFLIPMSSRQR
jgi:iron complex transport system ATP-binding protein